jgi:outer membrane protein OmpA-like peptidoglycan-associated protein
MFKLITITALIGLVAAPALAQVAVPKSDGQVVITESQTPLFRVTVVGRTTSAINYRPRSGDTKVDLAGTPLMPEARGVADVSGKKGYFEIEAHFDKMKPATSFGSEYLTYVLWAITPEGRAKNLGEVQIKDDDTRVQVTTELQAFALILTAEPYFAVSQPSDVVVMENVVRDSTKGSIETVQAKYELLKRGSYVMNVANYKAKPVEPGVPLDLAEARNAVDLAGIAGADRYAGDTYAKAQRLLGEAERAREEHKRANDIMMPARQAAQTAEDARLVAMQRQQQAIDAQQRVALAQRERLANERANEEAARRRAAELDAEKAAAAKATEAAKTAAAQAEAERARLENERAHQQALNAQADAERARNAADEAKRSADADAERARLQAQQAQAAAAQAEQQKALAEQQRAQAEQEKNALRDRLREQLNTVLETKETARGLIVNVSDVLFDTGSANLKPGAREKLARVAGILATQPDLHIVIEGHTDSVGTDDYNQRLSERRSEAVRTYLMQQKIPAGEVEARGFGESRPVASNDTAAGRQQNRRVEMVVTGASIGKTATVTGATQ